MMDGWILLPCFAMLGNRVITERRNGMGDIIYIVQVNRSSGTMLEYFDSLIHCYV